MGWLAWRSADHPSRVRAKSASSVCRGCKGVLQGALQGVCLQGTRLQVHPRALCTSSTAGSNLPNACTVIC
jgi:hypothetical protein